MIGAAYGKLSSLTMGIVHSFAPVGRPPINSRLTFLSSVYEMQMGLSDTTGWFPCKGLKVKSCEWAFRRSGGLHTVLTSLDVH